MMQEPNSAQTSVGDGPVTKYDKNINWVNMLICLKNILSQYKTEVATGFSFFPTPMQHNLGQSLQGAECLSSLTSRGAEDARYPLERAILFL